MSFKLTLTSFKHISKRDPLHSVERGIATLVPPIDVAVDSPTNSSISSRSSYHIKVVSHNRCCYCRASNRYPPLQSSIACSGCISCRHKIDYKLGGPGCIYITSSTSVCTSVWLAGRSTRRNFGAEADWQAAWPRGTQLVAGWEGGWHGVQLNQIPTATGYKIRYDDGVHLKTCRRQHPFSGRDWHWPAVRDRWAAAEQRDRCGEVAGAAATDLWKYTQSLS